MASYRVSPFDTRLQTGIFTGAATDEFGKTNLSGSNGSVYTIRIDATNSGGAINYLLMWDQTAIPTAEADVVIPIGDTEEMVVWVDKGITFNSRSSDQEGGVAPSGTVNVNLFNT